MWRQRRDRMSFIGTTTNVMWSIRRYVVCSVLVGTVLFINLVSCITFTESRYLLYGWPFPVWRGIPSDIDATCVFFARDVSVLSYQRLLAGVAANLFLISGVLYFVERLQLWAVLAGTRVLLSLMLFLALFLVIDYPNSASFTPDMPVFGNVLSVMLDLSWIGAHLCLAITCWSSVTWFCELFSTPKRKKLARRKETDE